MIVIMGRRDLKFKCLINIKRCQPIEFQDFSPPLSPPNAPSTFQEV